MAFRGFVRVAAILLVLNCAAAAQFLPNYVQSESGLNLTFFLQADVNRDGHMDTVGIRGTQITVLLGNGKGGFGAPINSPISGIDSVQTTQFIVGDFNNDGKPDVLLFGKDHVTGVPAFGVMLGNGDGTFQLPKETTSPYTIPTETAPSVITVVSGDFNGDDKLDLAYFGGPGVVVMLGKGDGTFSSPITTTTVFRSLIAVGNFNSDKNLDLVGVAPSLNGENNNLSVLLGKGDGTFEAAILSTVTGGWPMEVADLNDDGYTDVLLGPSGAKEPSFTVLLNDGSGHFPTSEPYSAYPPPNALDPIFAIRDLNGDGHPDVAMLDTGDAPWTIGVFLNNGDGTFTVGRTYVSDGKPAGIGLLAADLNGDGKVDLAFGNAAGGISVLLGNGNGTFRGNFVGLEGVGPTGIRVGDFNNDGKPDLLALPGVILIGVGDGTFRPAGGCGNVGTAALRDFNGDGKLDVAGNIVQFDGTSPPAIQVFLGNGDGGCTAGGQFDQGIQHELVLGADFNNDGKFDLAASDQNGFSILLGNGDGTFQPGIPTAVDASFPTFVIDDFNNDGKEDIVALTPSGIAVFLGKGDGRFSAPVVSPGPTAGFLTTTDLNKDGKRDLVVTTAESVIVLLGKGNGSFEAPVHYALSSDDTTQAVVADFNGDGKLDIAVGVSGGINTPAVDVLFGDGTGKLSTPTIFRTGTAVTGIAEADFNLDHQPDVAVVLRGGAVVTLLNQR